MAQHFTALIRVTKITEAYTEKLNGVGYGQASEVTHEREAKDITEVVVRAPTRSRT